MLRLKRTFGTLTADNPGGIIEPTHLAIVIPAGAAPLAVMLAATITAMGAGDTNPADNVWARVVVWLGDAPPDDFSRLMTPGDVSAIRGDVVLDAVATSSRPLVLPELATLVPAGAHLVCYMGHAFANTSDGTAGADQPARRCTLSVAPSIIVPPSDRFTLR